MEHTKACIKRRESRLRAIAKWKTKWPNHCTYCLGQRDCGDPCLRCMMYDTCPRCGMEDALHPEDATIPCKFCGWRDGYEEDGCPHELDCECRVAKAEQQAYLIRQAERRLAAAQEELAALRNRRRS